MLFDFARKYFLCVSWQTQEASKSLGFQSRKTSSFKAKSAYVNSVTGFQKRITVQTYQIAEAATRSVLCKKVFLEVSQNLLENTCQSLFLNKVAGLRPATLSKKRLWHRCFPVNFVKFPRTPFLQNTSGWLLLKPKGISDN